MDNIFVAIVGFIGVLLVWLFFATISVGVTVGAFWIVCKLFGIDIDGFTA